MLLISAEQHSQDGTRYSFVRSFRDYVSKRLEQCEPAEFLHKRHAEHYADLLRHAESQQRGPDQPRWLRWVKSDSENINTALEWALRNDPETSVMMVAAA